MWKCFPRTGVHRPTGTMRFTCTSAPQPLCGHGWHTMCSSLTLHALLSTCWNVQHLRWAGDFWCLWENSRKGGGIWGGGGRGLKLKVQHHGVRGMGSGSWMSFTITVFQNCTQILKFQCIVIIVGDIFHLFFQNGKHNTYVWALQLSHYAMLYHCIKRT